MTKLSKLEMPSDRAMQAENFRKLLLAMSNDIRVLLVKLADRLHNMQTLHHIRDPAKRKRIAIETMEIYVPLAERIGMQQMKEELEACAFAEINPDALSSLQKRLGFLRAHGGDMVARISDALNRTIAEGGIEAQVTGREKKPYSIWRKMERKNISFEQLSDVMAFRVLVDRVADCYTTLGIVHRAYPMIPGRFKDYVSVPKLNKYRALHTTVIGPERKRIEVQICDREMLAVADYGVAAHWQYKQQHEHTDGSQYRWIRELLEILDHAPNAEEFLENTKLEMFQDEVFCFSPRGDLIVLPRGATPVDFAYAVHTEIGDTCVGAKVNGRLAPLRTQLANGDQVEIVRSSGQTPSPTWENLVVTGKARSAIRRFVRNQERSQYLALGKSIVDKALARAGRAGARRPAGGGARYPSLQDRGRTLHRRRPGRAYRQRRCRGGDRRREQTRPRRPRLELRPFAGAPGPSRRRRGANPRADPRGCRPFRRLLPPAAWRSHRRNIPPPARAWSFTQSTAIRSKPSRTRLSAGSTLPGMPDRTPPARTPAVSARWWPTSPAA